MAQSIKEIIKCYTDKMVKPTHRYRSFDLCYQYFSSHKRTLNKWNLRRSCDTLWGFLGSWGMIARKTYLSGQNELVLKKIIEFASKRKNRFLWSIDVDNYMEICDRSTIKLIKESGYYEEIEDKNFRNIYALGYCFENFKKILEEEIQIELDSDTLVSKIMLGIYGNTPAFDQYVTKTINHFKLKKRNRDQDSIINKFEAIYYIYQMGGVYNDKYLKSANCNIEFNDIKIKTIDFHEKETDLYYSKAKIVDMFAFEYGKLV